jgi:PAS domain S-box-containing protein
MSRKRNPSHFFDSSQTVAEREAYFQLLVEHVMDYAIFMLNPEGYITTWNVGAERIKGYTSEEIIGQHFSIFYGQEDRARGKPAEMLRLATERGHYEDENWRVRKDGTLFWANVVITALYDEQHQLRGFSKVTRDISERKQAEQALQESEERFRLLVNEVSDYAIFMLNPEGYITTWNVGAERIKGYTSEEIIGRHFSIFYAEEDRAKGKPADVLRLAAERGHYEDENWRIRKDGTLFWANVVLTPLYDQQHHLRGFSKITRDLTERKQAEQRMIELEQEKIARAEAEKANALKLKFLAMISHELRTPLTSIKGFTSTLLQPDVHWTEAQYLEFIGIMDVEADKLTALIDQILDIARLNARMLRLNPTALSLADLLGQMQPRLAPITRNHTLETHIPGDLPLIEVDPFRMEQILTNLIENAAKYSAVHTPIKLNAHPVDGLVEIEVQDEGVGIPPEEWDSVFEAFQQVHQNKRPQPGAGLGLAICKGLVEAHGGSIRVKASSDKGTTIAFTLPIVTGHSRAD